MIYNKRKITSGCAIFLSPIIIKGYKSFCIRYKDLPFVVLFFIFSLIGCQKQKNVVLISIDTLRADHVGCYGYIRNTTPMIDILAEKGVVFNNAISTSSWTAPAMASLFTSLLPSGHNIKHGVCKSGNIYGQEILDTSFTTIAEVLKENGMITLGVSSNPHLTKELGFAQGFDNFTSYNFKSAEEVTGAALKCLAHQRKGSPFFLWVHYFDPHWPYSKHEPWIYTYAPNYNDELKQFYSKNLPKVRVEAGIEKGTNILQSFVALYDSEINYVDQCVGKLLDVVDNKENTMVILVSDHGEAFLEHDTLDHGYQLYEESIHVPLIIKCPDIKPVSMSFNTPCSIIDIPPTILDWLNIQNNDTFEGKSLLPLITGKVSDEANESHQIFFSELNRFGKNMISLRKGKWKYINDLKYKKEELYDLASDPSETNNSIGKKPFLRNEMRKTLSKWLLTVRKQKLKVKRAKLDVESVEKLKSLGYVE